MSRYWSEVARNPSPYVPGEQPRLPDLVKLNTNESPFGPSPRVLDAIRGAADDDLRLYPDPRSTRLREVLAHTFAALLKRAKPLLFPDVTYSFYPVYCRLFGIAFEEVPLDPDLRVDLPPWLERGGPVILHNPNAPTGIALPLGDVARVVRGGRDAAVITFAQESPR